MTSENFSPVEVFSFQGSQINVFHLTTATQLQQYCDYLNKIEHQEHFDLDEPYWRIVDDIAIGSPIIGKKNNPVYRERHFATFINTYIVWREEEMSKHYKVRLKQEEDKIEEYIPEALLKPKLIPLHKKIDG